MHALCAADKQPGRRKPSPHGPAWRSVTNSRRAEVILASAQGIEASEIAANYHFDVQHVRLIIRLFNEGGIDAIKAKKKPGRPVEFTPEHQSAIVELALIRPT